MQAVHVVGVEVGQDQQWDLIDVEPTQAAVDRGRLGTRVDDDACAVAHVDDQGITLPDVTGDDQPAARRPPGGRRHHDHGDDEEPSAGEPGRPAAAGAPARSRP